VKILSLIVLAFAATALVGATAYASAAHTSAMPVSDDEGARGCGGGLMHQNMQKEMMQNQVKSCDNQTGCCAYEHDYNWSYGENCTGDCQEHDYQYDYSHQYQNCSAVCQQNKNSN